MALAFRLRFPGLLRRLIPAGPLRPQPLLHLQYMQIWMAALITSCSIPHCLLTHFAVTSYECQWPCKTEKQYVFIRLFIKCNKLLISPVAFNSLQLCTSLSIPLEPWAMWQVPAMSTHCPAASLSTAQHLLAWVSPCRQLLLGNLGNSIIWWDVYHSVKARFKSDSISKSVQCYKKPNCTIFFRKTG